jgi:hypothetical protein
MRCPASSFKLFLVFRSTAPPVSVELMRSLEPAVEQDRERTVVQCNVPTAQSDDVSDPDVTHPSNVFVRPNARPVIDVMGNPITATRPPRPARVIPTAR